MKMRSSHDDMTHSFTLGVLLISLIFQLGCASSIVACLPAHDYDGSASAIPYNSFVGVASTTINLSNICDPGTTQPCITQNLILGSGSIVYRSKSQPNIGYIMTAKHICDHKDDRPDEDDIDTKFIGHQFTVRDQFSRDHKAIYYFSSSKQYVDVCILMIEDMDDSLAVAELAPIAPNKGDVVYNVAAPGGFLPNGVALTFSGFYSGTNEIVSVYTISSAGGSSGSPIFNKDGKLVGLLWGYPTKENNRIIEQISFSVPFEELVLIINSIDSADVIVETLVKKLEI